jgi:hypothetical protein
MNRRRIVLMLYALFAGALPAAHADEPVPSVIHRRLPGHIHPIYICGVTYRLHR